MQNKYEDGFTLVELAIVMLGLFLVMAIVGAFVDANDTTLGRKQPKFSQGELVGYTLSDRTGIVTRINCSKTTCKYDLIYGIHHYRDRLVDEVLLKKHNESIEEDNVLLDTSCENEISRLKEKIITLNNIIDTENDTYSLPERNPYER